MDGYPDIVGSEYGTTASAADGVAVKTVAGDAIEAAEGHAIKTTEGDAFNIEAGDANKTVAGNTKRETMIANNTFLLILFSVWSVFIIITVLFD